MKKLLNQTKPVKFSVSFLSVICLAFSLSVATCLLNQNAALAVEALDKKLDTTPGADLNKTGDDIKGAVKVHSEPPPELKDLEKTDSKEKSKKKSK